MGHGIDHTAVHVAVGAGRAVNGLANGLAGSKTIDVDHGDTEQKGESRAGDHLQGILDRDLGVFGGYLVGEQRKNGCDHEGQNTRIVQELERPVDLLESQDIVNMQDKRLRIQDCLDAERVDSGQEQDYADDQVRKQGIADPQMGISGVTDMLGGLPFVFSPFFHAFKGPLLFGDKEALSGGNDRDHKSRQESRHGDQFGARDDGHQDIDGSQHAADEEAEGNDRNNILKRFVPAEYLAQDGHAHNNDRDTADHVGDTGENGQQTGELVGIAAKSLDRFRDHIGAGQGRYADRTGTYRC